MFETADHDPFATSPEIARLLSRWNGGEAEAGGRLISLVYQQLHLLAERLIRTSGSALDLQPTELIAEVWLRLDRNGLNAIHRRHFMALSARIMRQVLIDHARRLLADKRGGGCVRITLTQAGSVQSVDPMEIMHLDQGLTRLATLHPRAGRAIEMHYFGGMTEAECAAELGVSDRTIERDLRFGRAWLKGHLDVD